MSVLRSNERQIDNNVEVLITKERSRRSLMEVIV